MHGDFHEDVTRIIVRDLVQCIHRATRARRPVRQPWFDRHPPLRARKDGMTKRGPEGPPSRALMAEKSRKETGVLSWMAS